jgi:hypothetical protein
MIAKALDSSRKSKDGRPTDGIACHVIGHYRRRLVQKMTAERKKWDSLVMPLASLRETAQFCRNSKTFLQASRGVREKKSDFGRISVH